MSDIMTQENTLKDDFALINPTPSNALAAIESSRAVAEVQASLVIARANPRNEALAERAITNACKRVTLARSAMYLFRRGTTNVTGPTIRLAEVLARSWGNINYGFRELDRDGDSSEVEAFAHDLQTNTRVTRQFRVKHWRDTRQGGQQVTAERDKYELVANMAQRRVRACLLELIPGDIVEMAIEACEATLNGSIGDLDKAIKGILVAFEKLGVSEEDIEGYLQRKLASLVPADIVSLRKIHTSISTGIAPKEEFFRQDDVDKLNERFSGNGKGKSGANKAADKKKADQGNTGSTVNSSKPETGKPPEKKPGGSDKAADKEVKQEPPIRPESTVQSENKQAVVPGPGVMVACPEAGGMMVDSADCKLGDCFEGCKAFREAGEE